MHPCSTLQVTVFIGSFLNHLKTSKYFFYQCNGNGKKGLNNYQAIDGCDDELLLEVGAEVDVLVVLPGLGGRVLADHSSS